MGSFFCSDIHNNVLIINVLCIVVKYSKKGEKAVVIWYNTFYNKYMN